MARRTPAERNQHQVWSRMYAAGPAKVDLCKINTDAFRHMTADQLQLAHTRVGWGRLPKAAETRATRASSWRKIPREGLEINALLDRFIAALREIRSPLHLSKENIERFHARWPRLTNKQDIANNIRTLKAEHDPRIAAERIEQQIWDLQARKACRVKPEEQVARDAVRAGRPREAARIRRKAIIR